MKNNYFVLIHYDELALKGKNRFVFEKKLKENICLALQGYLKKFNHSHDKFILELNNEKDYPWVKKILKLIPGIANYSFAHVCSLDIEEIKERILQVVKKKEFQTFRVSAKRSNKKFDLTSQQINEEVGYFVASKLHKKVKLNNSDLEIYIEIGENKAVLYFEKIKGVGGLPVGTSGKVICSISGGIDSPVAAFMGMKRGLKVVLVHIFNKTINEEQALIKVTKITENLSLVQGRTKLYIIPFEKIQKAIIANVPSQLRMIIYRRFMLKIINKIAFKEKAKGIITGDSLGQVASQTIENLNCIYKDSDLPIFPPLIGMNKNEIIKIAKKLGTYESSILPYADCCSFMLAKHPETKGKIGEIEKLEAGIEEKEQLIKECVKEGKIIII